MSIAVFGSINMDLVVRSPHIPVPGETILGSDFVTVPGGKGANQAVAAAQLGLPVHLIGAVGDDGFGQQLRQSLRDYAVDITHVQTIRGASGVALITVDDKGENTIVVASGANMRMTPGILDAVALALDDSKSLLLQLEVPYDLVLTAAHLAKRRNLMVILDPAPAPQKPLPAELYALADIITPNENETLALTGIAPVDDASAAAAANVLHQRGAQHVVIKRGAQGVVWSHAGQQQIIPTFVVPAVDTVAAGDCYNGALAVALHDGMLMPVALRFAAASAAIAVTRRGAQSSMPNRREVLALLGQA
ncbi:MAG: ribokinase [Chloroflexi bacterium]|nr:MAG: ribokinase [Chloroflexota bacterium]